MLKLLEDCYLVGSGQMGLSHETDANVYLIDGHGRLALIDAGSGLEPELIIRNIERIGFSPSDIELILNTHCHWDHSRGDNAIKQHTECDVAIHEAGVSMLEEELWANHLVAKTGLRSKPTMVDRVLHDGDEVRVGPHFLKVIHTPGHSPDSVTYLWELPERRVIFTGDTLEAGGGLGSLSADTDFKAYRATLRKIIAAEPDTIFPGHHAFAYSRADKYAEHALSVLEGKWHSLGVGSAPFYPSWWLGEHLAGRLELSTEDQG